MYDHCDFLADIERAVCDGCERRDECEDLSAIAEYASRMRLAGCAIHYINKGKKAKTDILTEEVWHTP